MGFALAAVLIFSGLSKFMIRDGEGLLFSPSTYYLIGALELGGSLLLATRAANWVAVAVIAMCLGGLLYVWLDGSKPCGCLGAVELSRNSACPLGLGHRRPRRAVVGSDLRL